jgi:hypothetical protein
LCVVLAGLLLCARFAIAAGESPSVGPSIGQSVGWTVDTLVALLKEQRTPAVAFEEVTHSSLLTEPLMVRGQLRFTPPATLEKIIASPYRERYVIEGDRVLFESERKKTARTISLEDYPALRSFVEAFRATFTGDVVLLQRIYDVTLGGTRAHWSLLLRPRDAAGRSMVDSILFTGSEGRVETIAIRSPDGDRSVMTLRQDSSR